LTGSFGTASAALSGLFKAGPAEWAWTSAITTPLFSQRVDRPDRLVQRPVDVVDADVDLAARLHAEAAGRQEKRKILQQCASFFKNACPKRT
jgi:hypothetical protein